MILVRHARLEFTSMLSVSRKGCIKKRKEGEKEKKLTSIKEKH